MNRRILIRIDDFCPTMNWKKWELAKEWLDRYNIKPLIGVIPDNKYAKLMIDTPRENFWLYVKTLEQSGYKIAMHGFNHTFQSHGPGIAYKRETSEFANLSYQIQYEMIRQGKTILESHGITTDVFFAPGHSYDENTVRALAQCGFKYISDGMSFKPLMREGVVCIPCRTTGCPKIKGNGYITAVFHTHEWALPDKSSAEKKFTELIENEHQNIVTFDEYAQRTCGLDFIQKTDERIYSFYFYNLKPELARIKHWLLRGKCGEQNGSNLS